MSANCKTHARRGGVYIAVLGSALVISLLGITALIGQRIQSRIVMAASDIRQAQLNAATAVELGLLKIKTDSNWRSQLDAQSYLIKNRGLAAGVSTCSLQVFDAPTDAVEVADKPLRLVAIGRRGPATGDAPRTTAEQRMEVVIEPRRKPHDCLRQASTAKPDWASVFAYYQAEGTQIPLNSLPTTTPNLSRNVGMETATGGVPDYWTGEAPSVPAAQISRSNNYNRTSGGTYSMRVQNRADWYSGPAQRIDKIVKPGSQYSIETYVLIPSILTSRVFRISLYTKGTGNSSPLISYDDATVSNALSVGWRRVVATLPAQNWSGDLDYAFVKVAGDPNNTADFYMDDVDLRETTTGRYIYRSVLSPSTNPFGATNSRGLYWIDCQGSTKLVIERSRIFGTLLVLNPGPGSCIDYGPIHMSPAVPGFPALLVSNASGNIFSIRATPDPTTNPADDALSEADNEVNYNPTGAPHKSLGTDSDQSDKYDSEIRGLVLVSGNLSYASNPTIRGQVVVGGTVSGTRTFEYRPDSLLNPPPGLNSYRFDRRPASVRKSVLP